VSLWEVDALRRASVEALGLALSGSVQTYFQLEDKPAQILLGAQAVEVLLEPPHALETLEDVNDVIDAPSLDPEGLHARFEADLGLLPRFSAKKEEEVETD